MVTRWEAGWRDAGYQWPLPEMQELKEGVRGLAGGPQRGMKIPPRSSKIFSCPSFSSSGVGFFLFPRRLKRHPLHPARAGRMVDEDTGKPRTCAPCSVCARLVIVLLAHFPDTLLLVPGGQAVPWSGACDLPLLHRLGKEVTSAHVFGMWVAGGWMHLGGQVGWIWGSMEVVVGAP